jgi:HD-GYP domain-containing protein (c-di-GMP phosphodiesterase class II)
MLSKKRLETSLLEQINMNAIEDFCQQIYYCDPYTAMHAEHVAELMSGLACQMEMSSDEIHLAYMVGVMHDVGKIKTPVNILTKAGRLTDLEWQVMRRHSVDGADMLAVVQGGDPIVRVMRHHHERHDGRGYPDGLMGDNIPLLSRMLAVCDAFDAMITKRCYREPVDLAECLHELQRCAGTQFDPDVCKTFIEFVEERFGFSIADGLPSHDGQ